MKIVELINESDDNWDELSQKVSKKSADQAIKHLQKDLKDPIGYEAVDHMMTSIAKKYNMTPHNLHLLFVEKVGTTPDVWIRKIGPSLDKWINKK